MSEKSKKTSNLFFYCVVSIVIIIDQLTKLVAGKLFTVGCNSGIAFGLNLGDGVSLSLSAVILIYLFYLATFKDKKFPVPLALIFGGGFSNLLDRLIIGCVRDFVDFGFWPSFNLADSTITLGVVLFLYELIRKGAK